jgi:uncharacterized membrane protein YphA (DoxX/SURF4 family)
MFTGQSEGKMAQLLHDLLPVLEVIGAVLVIIILAAVLTASLTLAITIVAICLKSRTSD